MFLYSESFEGDISLAVTKTNATSGGLRLHSNSGFSTNDYGALTFAVKTNITNLDIFPYVETTSGQELFAGVKVSDYVYGSINNDWKVVWIPLRDLTNNTNVNISDVWLEVNAVGTVFLDEVRVVEKLVWPLPEVTVGKVSGYIFGDDWKPFGDESPKCEGVWKLHPAVDYSSDQTAGKIVVATHSGKVALKHEDSQGWGWHVVIQSKGNAFATVHTHLNNPVVEEGQEVSFMQPIGETNSLVHLHFMLWGAPYPSDATRNEAVSKVLPGALCASAFPGNFVNPERIDWQPSTLIGR